MFYYDRIDIVEGIDINRISASKEFDIFHYWYFLYKGFKFQPYVCNRFINDAYKPSYQYYFKH